MTISATYLRYVDDYALFGGFGANRLRAVMAEQFKDLPDIRARKEMLTSQHDDSSAMFFDIEEQVAKALSELEIKQNYYALKEKIYGT